jgi:phenylacetate-CoA ligase
VDVEWLAQKDIEQMHVDELLQNHIRYCQEKSPYYRQKLAGLNPQDVTPANIAELPLTGKDDLSANNQSFFAVSDEQAVDIVFSSGTTGYPVKIVYTENDLQRLAENERRSLAATGLGPSDTVLLTCTMDRCFIAGFAYFSGVRALGAAAVRNGLGSLESHAEILRRTDATAIIGVPTFLRKLAGFLIGQGMNPRDLPVRRLVCIGEPLRDAAMNPLQVAQDLESLWNARVYSTYASSETITSFCECEAQQGGHLLDDLAVVEIVDDHGRVLPDGEIGEVVVTPLRMEGTPLIRFRTGDISFLLSGACSCGRTTPRLGPILGRKQQMMKISGTTLYPQAVFNALDEVGGISEYYIEVEQRDELSDHLRIVLSLPDNGPLPDGMLEKLQARLRVKPELKVRSEGEVRSKVFAPGFRKPVRFFDQRG